MADKQVVAAALGQLDTMARDYPEWEPWLALYADALQASAEPLWEQAVPIPTSRPATGVPLLDGAVVALDPTAASGWLHYLVGRVVAIGTPEPEDRLDRIAAVDPLRFLRAAIASDAQAMQQLAAELGVALERLAAVGNLAALPFLQACGRRLGDRLPVPWVRGFCPICGAWPAAAERRGLARERHLRCGRCGADWVVIAFWCPYCTNGEHEQLGSLVPEEGGETRQVDTCRRCRGYVKSITTLRGWSPAEVPVVDLATADLDLAAIEHGYTRPTAAGHTLRLRMVAA
ncbi:MAG: formate dehydrogenase accessory protein FdhE [Sphaerobacter sp.]|nr:formate dehydrogenase accessory protein FdhE [Sphaerobacter sp.]